MGTRTMDKGKDVEWLHLMWIHVYTRTAPGTYPEHRERCRTFDDELSRGLAVLRDAADLGGVRQLAVPDNQLVHLQHQTLLVNPGQRDKPGSEPVTCDLFVFCIAQENLSQLHDGLCKTRILGNNAGFFLFSMKQRNSSTTSRSCPMQVPAVRAVHPVLHG